SKKVIPGCAQTFSKGYTQYVQGVAPIFLDRGEGCRVWDVDGNQYIDYVQGLLPNILGYAHEEVNRAVAEQLARGHSFSLAHPLEFAAVIMEPINFFDPAPGFLEGVKDLARKHGAILIFDEICSGFHLGLGGAQKLLGVTPDLACFGKAMGNGFPIACVVGRTDVMRTFDEIFYSFTFAGEVASLAATMKVLDILEQTDA